MSRVRTPPKAQPWPPAQATKQIQKKASSDPTLCWSKHAKEMLQERSLLIGDLLHVLKCGFVYEDAQKTSRKGLYKYKIECTTPNSGGRSVRVVVIPYSSAALKIVTVMWADEDERHQG